LLLAATVRSFAHMPLGISDRNSIDKHIANLSPRALAMDGNHKKLSTT